MLCACWVLLVMAIWVAIDSELAAAFAVGSGALFIVWLVWRKKKGR